MRWESSTTTPAIPLCMFMPTDTLTIVRRSRRSTRAAFGRPSPAAIRLRRATILNRLAGGAVEWFA